MFIPFAPLKAVTTALIAVVPIAATMAIAPHAHAFSGLYVFGDSLSDTGNTSRQLGQLGIPAPGVPFPPPPYFQGRISNGPVWVEYLAPKLGLPNSPATNYAFAGATTGTANTINNDFLPLQPNLPGLQQPIAQTTTADPHGLYVVYAGALDYAAAQELGTIPNPVTTVGNLAGAVRSLYALGARNFLIPNLPNLGRVPAAPAAFAPLLTQLTDTHNSLLANTLTLLRTENPSLNLISVDVNTLFTNALNNPAQFGFTNVTAPCLDGSTLCTTPDQFLFWDQLHPTTAAHRAIADTAFSAIQASGYHPGGAEAVPEPSTMLGVALFGGGMTALRRQTKKSDTAA